MRQMRYVLRGFFPWSVPGIVCPASMRSVQHVIARGRGGFASEVSLTGFCHCRRDGNSLEDTNCVHFFGWPGHAYHYIPRPQRLQVSFQEGPALVKWSSSAQEYSSFDFFPLGFLSLDSFISDGIWARPRGPMSSHCWDPRTTARPRRPGAAGKELRLIVQELNYTKGKEARPCWFFLSPPFLPKSASWTKVRRSEHVAWLSTHMLPI